MLVYILEVLSQVEEIFWFTILAMSLYQLPQLESCGHDILKYQSLYTEGKEYVIRRTQSSSFLCVCPPPSISQCHCFKHNDQLSQLCSDSPHSI